VVEHIIFTVFKGTPRERNRKGNETLGLLNAG